MNSNISHLNKLLFTIIVPVLGALLGTSAGCQPNAQEHSDPKTARDTHNTQAKTMQPNPIVKTYQGELRGLLSALDSSIANFRGIPYAAPPVGDRRWQPPHAPKTWRGLKDATQFSPACPQPTGQENFVWSRDHFATDEDCLYLNIWSQLSDTPQPVMVWFHGGAHTSGKAHDKIFDGTHLASNGVVLVSVNYRLGPLGFLAHPALSAESSHASSGNYGLTDKIAALNWIRDNIAQFGGDANNITIFGQSAGSQSVCALMASPLAKGMFHKVIGQSASCFNPSTSSDSNGEQRGIALANHLGPNLSLAQLRQRSPEELLQAADATGWARQSRIVEDGWVLPTPPADIFSRQEQAQVPLLIGSLSNEGHQLFGLNKNLTLAELDKFLGKLVGQARVAELKALYAEEIAQSPGLAQREINTDLFMAYSMRRWAQLHTQAGHPTYLYFMDHNPPAFRLYNPAQPDLKLPEGPRSASAYHSGDLAYVFGNTHIVGHDWQAIDHELSKTIVSYWTNFAKTGNPNGPGLPTWPEFDLESEWTQVFDESAHTERGVRKARLDVFAAALEVDAKL